MRILQENTTNENSNYTDTNSTIINNTETNSTASSEIMSNISENTGKSNTTYLSLKDKKNISAQNCHKYEIDKKNKSIELKLDDLVNLSHILITEKEVNFDECSSDAFKSCSSQSNYCICIFFTFKK